MRTMQARLSSKQSARRLGLTWEPVFCGEAGYSPSTEAYLKRYDTFLEPPQAEWALPLHCLIYVFQGRRTGWVGQQDPPLPLSASLVPTDRPA